MDKENSGNLDDILKGLKNQMENSYETALEFSSQEDMSVDSDPIDPELLKEKLREQFMTDTSADQEENQTDEYAIDSDLISEFYEEAQNTEKTFEEDVQASEEIVVFDQDEQEEYSEMEEELVVEESDIEENSQQGQFQEGDIVEIVIPWVEQIEDEKIEEAEDEEQEDFGGELNEDYFDDEASENSYVCFADDEVVDEEFFEQNEEIEEAEEDGEYDLPWYEDFPTVTSVSEDTEKALSTEEPHEENEVSVSEETVIEEEPISEEEIFDEEEPFDEETFVEEEAYEIILPISADEYDEDEDYIDRFMDEEEEENLSLLGVQTQDEELAQQMDIDDLFVANAEKAEEVIPKKPTKSENVDDGSSFYRMMIEERDKREKEYGYFADKYEREKDNSDALHTEEIDIPEFNHTADVKSTEDFYGTDEHDANFEEHAVSESMPVFDYDHEETRREEHTEADTTNIVWRRAKPILMSFFALAILVLELLPIIGIVPDGILDYTSYPWTYIFIDAQLLIFAAALCYNNLFDGLLKLLRGEADLYSILSITIIVTLIGSILSCFCANDDVPRLYNFISAAYLLVVYFIEKIDSKRIKESIEILSEDTVFMLKRSQGKNSCAEKMYAGGLNPDTSILEPAELENESFDGVFSRERIFKKRNFANNLIVSSAIPIFIFAIFMAMISIVKSAGLAATVNAFSFTFVLLAPICATISYYMPILISHMRLSKRGCVIAGYEGAADVADCDAVVFEDGHLFKECNASETGIKLYCEDSKTRDLFVCLGAVYSKLGGPMQNTFASILGDEEHKVNMIRITRNGFEAVVDNKTNIIVGSSEYLSRYGIVTDRADAKEQGVIYAVMNSSLCAKISVNYKTQPLFEELSAILEEYGVKSVIKTYDPVVSGKYVAKCRDITSSPISVVHSNINDYNLDVKHKSVLGKAGAFATSSRLKLVELLTFCKRITRLAKINAALLIVSYSVGAVACILLSLLGGIEEMNLLWALLYQAIFVALSTLIAIRLLPLSFEGIQKKKIKKQEKENRFQYE